jgi:hypothetical protein
MAAWAELTRANLAERGVSQGLSSGQQQRLVQLIHELTKGADVAPWARPSRKYPWIKHGSGYIGKLVRKTKAARAALEDLRRYLKKIDFPTSDLHRQKNTPFDATLDAAMTVLDITAMQDIGDRRIAHLAALRASDASKRSLADATETLVTFFMDECGLGKYEADRRTAVIGNWWWDWNIAVDNEWTQGESGAPGSGAIRKRRTRRLRRDTPKKLR